MTDLSSFGGLETSLTSTIRFPLIFIALYIKAVKSVQSSLITFNHSTTRRREYIKLFIQVELIDGIELKSLKIDDERSTVGDESFGGF